MIPGKKTHQERLEENLKRQQEHQPQNQKGISDKEEAQNRMRMGLPGLALRELAKKDVRQPQPGSSGVVR